MGCVWVVLLKQLRALTRVRPFRRLWVSDISLEIRFTRILGTGFGKWSETALKMPSQALMLNFSFLVERVP